MSTIDKIIEGLKTNNYRMLSRAISMIENRSKESEEILDRIFEFKSSDYRIGVTGPPGAGKSTLVASLVKLYREKEHKVGIIAVDPTSPFSGGAVLGDRIRMNEVITDPGIFIRSMATRGSLGGLSKTAQEVADLMSAGGMDIIIFETVGVGQMELDVARASDTTLVLLVPESGDSIQAMKAGLMEIADIFVINKADRDGAERMLVEIETMLQLRTPQDDWKIPIHKTIANQAKGIHELFTTMNKHSKYLSESGLLERNRYSRIKELIEQLVRERLENDFWNENRKKMLNDNLEEIINHKKSLYAIIHDLHNMN